MSARSRIDHLDPFAPESGRYGRAQELERATGFASTVYTWMAVALGLTAMAVALLGNNEGYMRWMLEAGGFRILPWVLLGYSLALQFLIRRLPTALATLGFFGFAGLMGLSLAPIVQIYTQGSLITTFGVAAGTFGVMAAWGSVTRRDLTKVGSMFAMATIGLFIAFLVNMWFKNPMADLVLSGFGVLIFTGLSAVDAQRIRRIEESRVQGDEATRLAVLCALHMYLNVINLFLFLLRFLGNRR